MERAAATLGPEQWQPKSSEQDTIGRPSMEIARSMSRSAKNVKNSTPSITRNQKSYTA